jgi:hypothetical protein
MHASLDSSVLYIVQGVDNQGRKFSGVYTAEDAAYLVATNRLNRIIGTK